MECMHISRLIWNTKSVGEENKWVYTNLRLNHKKASGQVSYFSGINLVLQNARRKGPS